MTTRSLTVVNNDEGVEIGVLYGHWDGYPTGHGERLKAFFEGLKLVNGISVSASDKRANGMECLFAQLISEFKTSVGGFYLYPAGTRGMGEEYVYVVYPDGDNKLCLRLDYPVAGGKFATIYDGSFSGFNPEAAENNE